MILTVHLSVDWNSLHWNDMGINWAEAYAKGQAEKAQQDQASPAPSDKVTGANVAPSSDLGSVSHINAEDSIIPVDNLATEPGHKSSEHDHIKSSQNGRWKNLIGHSNNRKVFGLSTPTRGKEVDYVSNVGIPEGSNMIKVEDAEKHVFTNEFINTSKEAMTVVVWNKAASQEMKDPLNANPNLGASIAPEHAALTIPLDPGQSQVVAFMDESVVAWSQATESRATSGGFSTTWGEAQFNSSGSGYDVSAIQNPNGSNYVMEITSSEANSCASTQDTNMWITDVKTVGSGSCFIAQKTAHLTTKMGGYIS